MMVRTPHGYYDTALITRDLEEAGFSSITIDTIAGESRGPSARIVALAYCQGTPVSAEISARGDINAATDYVTSALTEKYGAGEMVGKNPGACDYGGGLRPSHDQALATESHVHRSSVGDQVRYSDRAAQPPAHRPRREMRMLHRNWP